MFRTTLALIAVCLLLAGCGGETNTLATTDQEQQETAVSPTLEAAANETTTEATSEPEPETAVSEPTDPLEPTATAEPQVTIEYDLAQNLAELPPIPRVPLPEGETLREGDSFFDSPHISIIYLTDQAWESLEPFYQATLPMQGWSPKSASGVHFTADDMELDIYGDTPEGVDGTQVTLNLLFPDVTTELPPIPLPADAVTTQFEQRYTYASNTDPQELLDFYVDYFQSNLRSLGWAPRQNYAWDGYLESMGSLHVAFNYGGWQNEIAVEVDDYDEAEPFIVQTRLAFEKRDDGYGYVIDRCQNSRNFVVAEPAPVPENLDAFASERVNAYVDELQTAVADNKFNLLCAESNERGATYEWTLGNNEAHYRLMTHIREEEGLWRMRLVRLDLAIPSSEQYLFEFDYNIQNQTLDISDLMRGRRQPFQAVPEEMLLLDETLQQVITHLEAVTGESTAAE